MNIKLSEGLIRRLLKKYMIIAILIGILVGGVASLVSYKLEDTYTSTGQMVQNDSNYSLIDSYKQFIISSKFNTLMSKQINNSKWKKNKQSYNLNITTTSSSPFFSVSASSNDGEYAQYITDLAMKVLIVNVGKYLSGANISMVSSASIARKTDLRTHIIKVAVVAFIISTIVSFMALSIKEVFFGKIRDEAFVSDVFQLNNLGSIDISNRSAD